MQHTTGRSGWQVANPFGLSISKRTIRKQPQAPKHNSEIKIWHVSGDALIADTRQERSRVLTQPYAPQAKGLPWRVGVMVCRCWTRSYTSLDAQSVTRKTLQVSEQSSITGKGAHPMTGLANQVSLPGGWQPGTQSATALPVRHPKYGNSRAADRPGCLAAWRRRA